MTDRTQMKRTDSDYTDPDHTAAAGTGPSATDPGGGSSSAASAGTATTVRTAATAATAASAPTAATAGAPGAHGDLLDADATGLAFTRLVHVELRKLVDTVAGRWVVGAILLLAAIAMTAMWFLAEPTSLGFGVFVGAAGFPVMLLLPILGILAATTEWSRRTGLVTFTLEPRRIRVALAKLAAAVLLGVVTLLAAALIAVLMTLLAAGLKDGAGMWDIEARELWGNGLAGVLGVAQGVGFGMLLGSTPLALVAYFVLPQVFQLLYLWDAAADLMPWIDLNRATAMLGTGTNGAGPLTNTDWAHVASAYGLWVALPIVLGTWMLLRREVK